jgi:hypothetical protein
MSYSAGRSHREDKAGQFQTNGTAANNDFNPDLFIGCSLALGNPARKKNHEQK